MSYTKALDYLYNHLPMFQRVGSAAYKNNLDNTLELDRMYHQPHLFFKTVHIAGTNGKGSVSHMLASVLQSAGYKTGLYTSPHLKDFRERIRVNGEMISEKAVVGYVNDFLLKNRGAGLKPSFFELTVSMAFNYFRECAVDIAVVEVGLGGRLDSTNIITPELSVITNISPDHTQLLGDTLEKIAFEKAGIIKNNTDVVIGETQPETETVFKKVALERGAPIWFADQDYLMIRDENGKFSVSNGYCLLYSGIIPDLKGTYQQKNMITAIAAIEQLKMKGISIPATAVLSGLANIQALTGLAGRWQIIGHHPTVICDTAHNQAGIGLVASQLMKEPHEKLHIVFGMVNDKETEPVLTLLPQKAIYYFTRASIERALDEKKLKNMASGFHLYGESFPTVKEALNEARRNACEKDLIFVGGSTFVVAEVL